MKLSARGANLIRRDEALRLESYRDQAGIWTIGWGHTSAAEPGMVITRAEAEALFAQDVAEAVEAVNATVKRSPSTTQAQFDAMVSLAFNIGGTAFAGSTLARMHRLGDTIAAAEEFGKWRNVTVNGKKQISRGLVARRAREMALYLEGDEGDDGVIHLPKPKPLRKSRTMAGGTAAGAGGLAIAGITAADAMDVAHGLTFVEGDLVKLVVAGAVMLAAGLVIYARISDWRHGR